MERRTFLKAMAAAPVAILTSGASVVSQSANICVFMEERDGAFVLEGSGSLLTEPFEMEAGRYRIEVQLSNPGRLDYSFWVDFYHRESGADDGYFAEVFEGKVPEMLSGSARLRNGGEYVAEIDFSGDWKIVLSPI